MKIQIRPRAMTLTKTQRVRLTRELDLVLARFGERIDRVTLSVSSAEVPGSRHARSKCASSRRS